MSEQIEYVYVVEYGCYADRNISAVYRTLEAAKAADAALEHNPRNRLAGRDDWTTHDDDEDYPFWSNAYDWSDSCIISRMKLEG